MVLCITKYFEFKRDSGWDETFSVNFYLTNLGIKVFNLNLVSNVERTTRDGGGYIDSWSGDETNTW